MIFDQPLDLFCILKRKTMGSNCALPKALDDNIAANDACINLY